MLMENFLRSKEYWTIVEAGVPKPTAGANDAQRAEIEKEKLKDLKAKDYLFQAIDRAILETILNKSTSKNIWDSMKKKYQGNERAKRQQCQALRAEFEVLQMQIGESVDDYFARTMAIANKMRIHGENLEDVAIVEKILRSMTTKFNYVVCSIEESNDIETLSLDELQNSLLIHERKINHQDKQEQAVQILQTQALQTTINSRADGRGKENWKGRPRSSKPRSDKLEESSATGIQKRWQNRNYQAADNRSKSVGKANIECFRYHRYSHYCSECRANLNRGESSNFVEHNEKNDDSSLFMVCHPKEVSKKNVWYLDTVKGKGKVTIRSKDNSIQTIFNVLYVPDLKSNLLSLGQLQEKGYEILIKDGVCQIRDSKLGLIAKVKMMGNRLFPLYLQTTNLSCVSAILKDIAWLWHCRFGHLYFGGLKALQQKKMVNDLPHFDSPSEICEICMVSKQHRDSFLKDKSWRAKQVLDLVHSDLCGLINPTSNGGKQYFITFVDDYSRKTWVYFLQTKSEALAAFKNFKVLAENEVGRSVKVLRTDHGGEFNSKEFVDFCESNGIKRQLTAALTPQQNGVCERRNCTNMNMVRSLMSKSSLPKEFWPEAVNWSVHILNRSPTSPLPDLTPEEAWSGRRPAIDYLRIFGCMAYAHVPDQKRKKSRQQIPTNFENEEDLTVQNSEGLTQQTGGLTSANLEVSRQKAEESLPIEVELNIGGSDLPQDDVPVNHFALFVHCDPLTYEEAVKEKKWQKAMAEEIGSIERNQTWELTDLPKGHKTIGVKWIYKTKLKENGAVDKYKAHLVAKAQNSWPIYQLDVKSAFLHGNLQEQVFIDQPPSYVKSGSEHKVYRLKKALYGLKQAPRAWYSRIDAYFLKEGFQKCPYEHTLYTKFGDGDFGLFYNKGDQTDLAGFTNSDYARDLDDRKSTYGFVFMLGFGAISWSSKKQPIVTLSITKAEYVAATSCDCQAIWLRRIMEELELNQHEATSIYCGNSLAIKLSRNPILYGRSKQIHVRYHFLRNLVEDGTIKLIYCRIEDQVADIFIKPLKVTAFSKLRELLGVYSM
ncbi:hypothetical protein SLEP1_g34100 [Rubroshorea leprosula]|uniref:Integrase catalytic domain-containing protein n=1 Tax=Rubroshorea leprosula TaxID=152421 RepID=A0AAV5KIT6_9ROSI|nr:hypothetical protein SLEP1_g34100 [Rubroshorea leprosula]